MKNARFLGALKQGSPAPGPWSSTGLWPVGNWAAQQEMSSRQVSKASAAVTATPHHLHYHLSSGLSLLIVHYGELCNYLIIYHNAIIIEIKHTINVMLLNHSQTIPPSPKTVFYEARLWCQKVGNHRFKTSGLGGGVSFLCPNHPLFCSLSNVPLDPHEARTCWLQ